MIAGTAPQGLKDALVILGAAGIVIPAFARLKISPVIGFILVGMIVGPFALGAVAEHRPWLNNITITDQHGIEPDPLASDSVRTSAARGHSASNRPR